MNKFLELYAQTASSDQQEGTVYYERQRDRLARRAASADLSLPAVIGAFAALSPNNLERTNWIALDLCIRVHQHLLPLSTKIPAYGRNREKAYQILSGSEPTTILKGNKVLAFYHNTLDLDNSNWITIDGHMANVYLGTRHTLKTKAVDLTPRLYSAVAGELRRAAFYVGWSAPRFQACLWLAHKRIHAINFSPQIPFEF